MEVSLEGAGVWVAVHGIRKAYLVRAVRLAKYSGTHRVKTVIEEGYSKFLSVLEPEAIGQTLHVSEADAKRAATLATPEAWLATEEDGSTCVHPARVLMFRFLAAEMRSREAV